ncbi:MAG TPA: Gmad2 immunoglobulin-like domain-containing protein [Gaiellaceae bacterium]|nr:Gmad2 immunoglobulin-like domain-containing protein [Gaiellaceae bacterium]
MKILLVLLAAAAAAALGFLLAGCGADEATPAGPLPSVPATQESGTSPAATSGSETGSEPGSTTAEPGGVLTYQVWLTAGESLFVVHRSQEATARVGTAALEALLAGPDDFEQGYGLSSAVPEGTQLLGLAVEDGIAHVDLTSEFESGGGTLSMQMRLAQVVFTLTQFPTVEGVLFNLDGEQVDVIGGEGIVVDQPLRRRDFRELLPAILVTSPALGQGVGNPVTVRGTANVFEANVSVEVLDAAGRELAATFTTATCGSGCRGSFSVSLAYDVDEAQDGTIVVHDDDAAGSGTYPHEVRIPVRLTPGA